MLDGTCLEIILSYARVFIVCFIWVNVDAMNKSQMKIIFVNMFIQC